MQGKATNVEDLTCWHTIVAFGETHPPCPMSDENQTARIHSSYNATSEEI